MKTKEKCPICYGYIYTPKQARAEGKYCVHEKERIVLGCMLFKEDLTKIAMEILKADDFDISEHRIIFKAIQELFNQKIPSDVIFSNDWSEAPTNVLLWLKEKGETIPTDYITSLAIGWIPGAVFASDSPVTASDIITYFAYQVKRDAVIRHFQKFISVPGKIDEFWCHLQAIETKIKQTQTYRLMLNQRSGEENKDWITLVHKSCLCGNEGKYWESIRLALEALRIDPRTSEAWRLIGNAYEFLGDEAGQEGNNEEATQYHREATKAWDKAREINPNIIIPGYHK